MKNRFASNEDLFQAVNGFVNVLEALGFAEASSKVKQGFSCLNGLTDGWALFEASLHEVKVQHGEKFSQELQNELEEILASVTGIVHRQ